MDDGNYEGLGRFECVLVSIGYSVLGFLPNIAHFRAFGHIWNVALALGDNKRQFKRIFGLGKSTPFAVVPNPVKGWVHTSQAQGLGVCRRRG